MHMGREQLQNFMGSDLRVIDFHRTSEKEAMVVLEGEQDDANFSANVRNDKEKTLIIPRRLLAAHGLDIETDELGISGGLITVVAHIRQRVSDSKMNDLIGLIQKGSFVAKPVHFDDTEPIDGEELRMALSQNLVQMSQANIDILQKDMSERGNIKDFRLTSSPGHLRYYPESSESSEWIRNRLLVSPGKIDKHSRPMWTPEETLVYKPDDLIGKKIEGFKSAFLTILTQTYDVNRKQVLNADNGALSVFDRNISRTPVASNEVRVQMFDRRREMLQRPRGEKKRAEQILTTSYQHANVFLDRLAEISGQNSQKRIAALIQNKKGVDEVTSQTESPWVKTNEDVTEEEQRETRQHNIISPYLPKKKTRTRSAEMKLLKQAQDTGMDEGAILVSETFPSHDTLNALVASEEFYGRKIFSRILFRHASQNNGPFFSNHDYNLLQDFLDHDIDVYWANQRISKRGTTQQGALLKLMRINHPERAETKGSMAYIPPERSAEFQKGMHLVFYGTARTLNPKYLSFMECLFDELDELYDPTKPFVVHSGGGPDVSTMGVANQHGRDKGWLSVGHVLGVKKEPTTKHLDAMMPFRNDNRDVRQGNMARAADVSFFLEGGTGTREERGISQTDIAIARDERPFPLILVGEEFYYHEYMQYLHETSIGTMDPNVLECISVVDLNKHRDAVRIARQYQETKKVLSIIPDEWREMRAEAIRNFARNKKIREQAWQLKS